MKQIEDQERERIASVKQSERDRATEDLERWKDEQRQLAEKASILTIIRLTIQLWICGI